MAETFTAKPKTKPVVASVSAEETKFETPKFEMPKFEIPKFEIPNMEVPAAFREFAEKGVTQAKDNWEKMKAATEEATGVLEESYTTASKGASDYGLKVIEISRANANSTFDYFTQLMTIKSMAQMVELSTAHARKQFETVTAQAKELSALAQKVATESAEPIKDGVAGAFKKDV